MQWGVLRPVRGLSPRDLRALSDLERRTVEVDGGRLKLEWGVLRSRAGRQVEDLLWWDGERLVGFLGMYSFGGPPTVELAGMVDPSARRAHIATALVEAALPLLRERGFTEILLVTPRDSVGGSAFARSRRAVLDHSEHALVLQGPPADGPADPRISLRTATSADLPEVSRLLAAGFGWAPADSAERLAAVDERTLVAELDGAVVATLRRTLDDRTADDGAGGGSGGGVYGFAVDPALQGRGIGRDILRRVCRQLRAEGAARVGLEVAVDNEHALGLYTSLGFTRVTTEDYYAVAVT